jgi:hypothetical protein
MEFIYPRLYFVMVWTQYLYVDISGEKKKGKGNIVTVQFEVERTQSPQKIPSLFVLFARYMSPLFIALMLYW